MIDVQDPHRQAMEIADQAVAAQKRGDLEKRRALFAEACRLESEAAHALVEEFDAEPTRSVLFRSAAALAIEAEQFARAAYLLASGLEGSPPAEIREELRELLRDVRGELKREPLSNEGFGGSDRVARYLSSCAHLRAAADRVRTALADRRLIGRELSASLIQDLLGSTEHSLRAFTGDTLLSVDLLGVGDAEVTEWVSALPAEWDLPRSEFARSFLLGHGETLLQGRPTVGQIEDFAREKSLSEQCLTSAEEAGIRALAANPVRAIDEDQADRPAFVLVALASQETAFADELACQILSETVSLLEVVVQLGWRDEVFQVHKRDHPGRR